MVQSIPTLMGEPLLETLAPFMSQAETRPEVWRQRMSPLPSPLKSGVAADDGDGRKIKVARSRPASRPQPSTDAPHGPGAPATPRADAPARPRAGRRRRSRTPPAQAARI